MNFLTAVLQVFLYHGNILYGLFEYILDLSIYYNNYKFYLVFSLFWHTCIIYISA